jgi:hypothetical protein
MNFVRLLAVLVLAAGMAGPAGSRFRTTGAAEVNRVFQDDFEDGNYTHVAGADGLSWQLVSGGASVDQVDGSQQLGVERGDSLIVSSQDMGLEAYTLRFQARLTWSAPGRVVVLYQDVDNYYAVGIGGDSGIYRRLNGVEEQLHDDPQSLVRLEHGSAVSDTFKVYVRRAGQTVEIKVDRAGDGVDYDIEVLDNNPAAAAAFADTKIGVQNAGSDPGTAWFYVDNLAVYDGLLEDPYDPQTYFVDNEHPLANDANPGTASQPWATIQHAADTVLAGDTVWVAPGVYNERITFGNRTRGALGQLITFKAMPSRSVTMWGFYTKYAHYLRIEGFNITTDASLTGWTEQNGVFIDSDYVEIVDNYLYDLHGAAISGGSLGAYVAGNRIYRSQMGITIGGEGWLVENNEVERLFNYGGGDSDYSRFFGEDHVFRGNFFHGTDFDEIGSAHVDCFQTFDNNGEYAYNILFDGNVCYDFHQGFMGESAYYGNTSDLTFQNNIFAHGGAWGLSVHQIRNVTVVHNVFADIRYHGAGFRDGATGVVRNNIFYNAGSNYWASDGGTVEGSHNLLYQTDGTVAAADFPADLVNLDPLFFDPDIDDYHILPGSPAIDNGMNVGVLHDLEDTSRPKGSGFDIGAYEFTPALVLSAAPADQALHLSWTVNVTLPLTTTWQIVYQGPAGDQPSPIGELAAETRAFALTGLTNYTPYTITLSAMLEATAYLTDTLTVMPSDHRLYLPEVVR